MKGITTYNILFFAIILVAVVLRCIGFSTIPFTHDELSAIYRLRFDNFYDLIHQGVYVDGHPAGIQVFLWFWTKIFGMSEKMVSLPFLLMGICCVPLTYRIGEIWFNRNAALAAMAIVAVSQYTVYYSIIARPYIAGLFFVLLLLLFWSKIIFKKDYKKQNFILIAIFSACCAYTHYFAMMTAFLISIAGLLFINKQHIKHYCTACLGGILLFSPHLPITYYQLFVLSGLEWLSPPDLSFIPYFIFFLLHYSIWAVIIFFAAFVINGNFSKTHLMSNAPKSILAFALFVLPLIIGYTYSVTVKPVIQFSCLIFSYPFLVLFVCSFIDKRASIQKAVSLVMFVTVMTATLFITRRHYDMLPRQQFEKSVQLANEYTQKHGTENVFCWLKMKTTFYEKKNNCTIKNNWQGNISRQELIKLLDTNNFRYAIVSEENDPEFLKIFKEHFPITEYYYPCLRSELYIFSKDGTPANNLPKTFYSITDSIRNFDLKNEYTILLDENLKDISENRFSQIYAKVNFNGIDSCNNYMLVCEVWHKKHLLLQQTVSTKDYYDIYGERNYFDLVQCVRNETFVKNSFLRRNYRVKIILRNIRQNSNVHPTLFHIESNETNRYIYCISEDIN